MTDLPTFPSAQLDLGFARRRDRTILDRRLFIWPFVLTRTFALDRSPAHMLTAIVQTGSGAVHGEDRLLQRYRIGSNAAAHVTTQGATSVHRAEPGMTTRDRVEIAVEPEGYLEYLPEARILFPDAALDQTVEIDCAATGIVILSDAFTVHDPEHRRRTFRRLAATTILRIGGGEPVLVDRMDICTPHRGRSAEFRAFGSMLIVAPGCIDKLVPFVADLSGILTVIPGLYGVASLLPAEAGIGIRVAGHDLRSVRAGVRAVWIAARAVLHGEPPSQRRKPEVDLLRKSGELF